MLNPIENIWSMVKASVKCDFLKIFIFQYLNCYYLKTTHQKVLKFSEIGFGVATNKIMEAFYNFFKNA